jgi:threonine dehydrogenase-like Zn-dependent dehydrogenase
LNTRWPGDHVVCSFIPNCGICRYCATGRQSICDWGATILEGYLPGEHFPFTGPRGQYGAMCILGTFSQYGVIHQNSAVKVDDDLPLDKAVLVGCGVPTGWGSAVNTAKVSPGDTVAIYGIGGIGINAVQGARYAGAKNVVAIDPLENKREKAMELGATHAFATAEEAQEAITQMTRGQGADSAILTVGLMTAEVVGAGGRLGPRRHRLRPAGPRAGRDPRRPGRRLADRTRRGPDHPVRPRPPSWPACPAPAGAPSLTRWMRRPPSTSSWKPGPPPTTSVSVSEKAARRART